MKVINFKVKNFRNVIDSGEVEIENLTCIVGKNQAGKTSILQALSGFNPTGSFKYKLSRDWPRKDRANKSSEATVCIITFQLEQAEITQLKQIAIKDFSQKTIVVASTYKNSITLVENQEEFPDHLTEEEAKGITAILLQSFEESHKTNVPTLIEAIEKGAALISDKISSGMAIVQFTNFNKNKTIRDLNAIKTAEKDQAKQQIMASVIQQFTTKYEQMVNKLKAVPTPREKAVNYLATLLPRFVYMDQYREFQGQAIINQVFERVNSESITPADETFLSILDLAELDLETLVEQGDPSAGADFKQERVLDVHDAGNRLTKIMAGHWSQNNFEVSFQLDGMNFTTFIKETDRDIGLIPLEEESKGFKWFFSFDLRFMRESNRKYKDCIILLDEPGIHLHPGAQKSLLERLKVFAEKNIVLYTTHMPFMVDLKRPDSIRILEGLADGTAFSNSLVSSGPNDKMTLQNALGMKCSQSYLVGQKNLIVEGYDDFVYITALSNALERVGDTGLLDDIVVTPAGGASEVVYMATFMIGQGLDTVALFDSDNAGRRGEEKLRKKWLLKYNDADAHTLLLGPACGCEDDTDFAIEEMFEESYYIKHFKSSHGSKLSEVKAKGPNVKKDDPGMISKKVEAYCDDKGIGYNKGSVAKSIQKELNKIKTANEFPNGTYEKAKNLIKTVDKMLSK